MESTWRWVRSFELKDVDNLLCPSPFVHDGLLYIFYGRQTRTNQAAFLECVQIDSSLKSTRIALEYCASPEHFGGSGNLPTSIYFNEDGGITLLCAEFSKSDVHKHRLLTHSHALSFQTDKVIVGGPQSLHFINYHSDEFHTIAGASHWEGSYYFAKGHQWYSDDNNSIPQTHIYRYALDKQTEELLPVEDERDVVAYARPNIFVHESQLYFAYSVRLKGGRYGSRLFRLESGETLRIAQSFEMDGISLSEDALAYQIPFTWKNTLWTLGTTDYRGSLGFSLFWLGEQFD
jgi:hypothetical protein